MKQLCCGSKRKKKPKVHPQFCVVLKLLEQAKEDKLYTSQVSKCLQRPFYVLQSERKNLS